ncbi:MAG: phosphocholine cytidylyltransferase family protein [Gammaproteobacteria bacterium]
MQAIILAAGIGSRLGPAHPGPKCLLEFGGRSLLARHFDELARLGIDDVTLVLGHAEGAIRDAARAAAAHTPLVHLNPDYREGSMLSLWYARHALLSGSDVLLMDADVLYDPRILTRLVESPHANCFLLDRDFTPGDEPVKICLDDGRIVEFRKRVAPGLRYNSLGESVGFFKFDADTATRLAGIVSRYVAGGGRAEPHEEALRDLALASDAIGVEDVTGLAWIEIDFPADVIRATQEILPAIDDRPTS